MEEHEHRTQNQKSTKEKDDFSRFMFGERQPRGSDHSEERSSTRPKHNDDWFWGRGRGSSNKDNHTQTTVQNKVESFIDNVDVGLLFDTYDTIVKTTEQYKPLFKEIAPFFSKFTNKFKKS